MTDTISAGRRSRNASTATSIPTNVSIHNKRMDADRMRTEQYCTMTQLLVGGDFFILFGVMAVSTLYNGKNMKFARLMG